MKKYFNKIDEVIDIEIKELKNKEDIKMIINKIIKIVKERQHLETAEKVFDLSEECNGLDYGLMQILEQPDIY